MLRSFRREDGLLDLLLLLHLTSKVYGKDLAKDGHQKVMFYNEIRLYAQMY